MSVSELMVTVSQRHVIPLQGRPYEDDQVGQYSDWYIEPSSKPGARYTPPGETIRGRPGGLIQCLFIEPSSRPEARYTPPGETIRGRPGGLICIVFDLLNHLVGHGHVIPLQGRPYKDNQVG